MSQLGVTYRGSSIILQDVLLRLASVHDIGYNKDSVDAAYARDRAPEAISIHFFVSNEEIPVEQILY